MRRKISNEILKTAIDPDALPEYDVPLNNELEIFVMNFLKIQSQTYLLHWQTESYARHKAYDESLESLGGLADSFIESYQGKYGRISISGSNSLVLSDINVIDEVILFQEYRDYLLTDALTILTDDDDDLKNIIDEMIAYLNKLLYLLTLE